MREADDSPSSSRALVVLAPAARAPHRHSPVQRAATFLAQLLANSLQLPQMRERRRAEPVVAIAAYRASIERLRRL